MNDPIFEAGQACPYCGTKFTFAGISFQRASLTFHGGGIQLNDPPPVGDSLRAKQDKLMLCCYCPACNEEIIWVQVKEFLTGGAYKAFKTISLTVLWPQHTTCIVPEGTPEPLATDYREAHATLAISPKASAALSRRCLQLLIREREGIQKRTLFEEVKALIALQKIPAHLAEELDAIRNIGNFAAHPEKAEASGEIVDVEPNEAEWTLQVLDQLMRFYFVDQPKSEARKKALNQKLLESGNKPML